MRTTKQVEQTSEIIEKRLKKKIDLNDIIVPILVFIVLIVLSVFVFVPMVESTMEFRAEAKEINQKMETLQNLETDLASLDDVTLQADLIVAKKVIPESLKVSNFVYYIDNLATKKNLESKELTASDTEITSEDEESSAYAVNGPLSYSGTLSNILSFLEELQSLSPYIVSIQGFSLREIGESSWKVSLTITGYYIPAQAEVVDLYEIFTLYTKYSSIMSVLREKAEQLEN